MTKMNNNLYDMKKNFWFVFIFCCFAFSFLPVSSFAASGPAGPGCGHDRDWKEKIMAEKIAYFTSELNLTPEEAQRFWPVYNMLQDEREKYHRESRDCMRLLEDAIREGQPEKEIARLLDRYIEAAENCDGMREKTRDEVSKVLSEEKTARLFIAEEHFMMKQFRNLKGKK